MSAITSLALTNVRCFEGAQRVGLPRIAVVVGENSAGKSTFLGCLRGMAKLASLDDLNDENHFDQPPFNMGPFSTIARSGAAAFALEATFEGHSYERVRVVYDEGPDGEPRERELDFVLSTKERNAPAFGITRLDPSGDTGREMWRVAGPDFEFDFEQSSVSYRQFSTWLSRSVRRGNLPHDGDPILRRKRTGDLTPEANRAFVGFVNFFRQSGLFPTSKQKLLVAANDPAGWQRERSFAANPFGKALDDATLDKIRELGSELGLFADLELHREPSGYEVLVDASGDRRNLVDVGFGVQSALPMLHAIAAAPWGATLLLQQPEAHLHPRTQAALVRVVASRGSRLLVETHSDHIPDWFRIAAMSGQVGPQDVGIAYFHRSDDGASTVLHDIRLDDQANLEDPPGGFREFFVDETERLLGFRR